MASVLDLPDELLVQILEQAADGQSPWSILQLALVDRAFARIAVPLIYKHIVLEHGFGWEPLLLGPSIKPLLYDTTKIAYVQSLISAANTLYCRPKRPRPGEISLEALVELKRDQIQGMIDETFGGEAEADIEKRMRWQLECLDKRSPIHLFALLFPRMLRLNTFEITELSEESWRILAESVECQGKQARRAGQKLPLQTLETVSFGKQGQAFHNNPTPITIILGWPCVKHITAIRVVDYIGSTKEDVEVPFPTLDSISPSLNTIRLVGSQLPAECLTKLLGSPRALETFEYQFGQVYASPLTLQVSELSTALLRQATNLRTIKLELAEPDYRGLGDVSSPMEFQYFKSLKKLVLGCEFLLGIGSGIQLTQNTVGDHVLKALPASLEEFSVTNCCTATEANAIVACLDAMIHNKEESLPALEAIHWRCRLYYECGIVLREEIPRLREHAELKAIELTNYVEEARRDNESAMCGSRPWLSLWTDGVRPWQALAVSEERRIQKVQHSREKYEEEEARLHTEV